MTSMMMMNMVFIKAGTRLYHQYDDDDDDDDEYGVDQGWYQDVSPLLLLLLLLLLWNWSRLVPGCSTNMVIVVVMELSCCVSQK